MATKTITLTGAEIAVTGLDGANAHIRNDSADVIYAAKAADITVGADGVMSIPAGQSATVNSISGTVYLLGTGSAQLVSNDYTESPFKSSVTLGSVAEEISRAVSNPNLLDNPDFKINQMGFVSGSAGTGGFCIDRWLIGAGETFTYNDDGTVTIECTAPAGRNFFQTIEFPNYWSGKEMTLSAEVTDFSGDVALGYNDDTGLITSYIKSTGIITKTFSPQVTRGKLSVNLVPKAVGSYATIRWIKLEAGAIATPFVQPNPATELAKCQRYYQIRSTGNIAPVDLRPSMATIKDIKQRSDGYYEYIAEP